MILLGVSQKPLCEVPWQYFEDNGFEAYQNGLYATAKNTQ